MDTQRSVPRGFELTPDLLATQGRALRGLARSLLGDAHAADDVVQETWLTCLRHPGALPVRVSAWLGTVARRLALRRVRGDARRRVREQRTAVPERLEGLAQRNLEREEALRAVTQALLALEEPFKTALFLRYYDGRTPSEIAAELELPLATVKSRLARGLEKLRSRLGAEFQGDEAGRTRALLALAGLPAPLGVLPPGTAAAPLVPTIGAALMGLKLQVAGVGLVLAGGALWWWQQPARERAEAEPQQTAAVSAAHPGVADARPPSPDPSPAVVAAGDSANQREVVAAPAHEPEPTEAFPPEAAFPYRISGRVRDERDLPLAGVDIYLAPRLFPFNRVATTDEEGRFEVEFDGRRPALDVAFAAAGDGRDLGLRELHLVSARELVVDVGIRSNVHVETQGSQITISLDRHEDPEPLGLLQRTALVIRARIGGRGSARLDGAPEMLRRANGRGLFVDPPPSQTCARGELHLRRGLEPIVLEPFAPVHAFHFPRTMPDYVRLALSARIEPVEPPPPATIRGIVRDAFGLPVVNAEVGWGPSGRTLEQSVRSDADGAFLLEGVPSGEHTLRAGGGDHGLAQERVTLASARDSAWSPILERGDEVAGRVVLFLAEQPLPDVRVELWSVSPSFVWCDSTLTNEDGRFVFPNVPGGALELYVHASGGMNPPSTFPIRVVRPVFARSDLGDVVLAVNEVVSSALGVAVLNAHDEPLPGAEVRVWHEATGLGCFAGGPGDDGKVFSLAGLPGGAYRVEVGGPFGWRALGRVWVDAWAEGGLQLGAERFAAPGLALLSAESSDGRAPSVSLWSAHPDVFGHVEALDSLSRAFVSLRAGEYVLCLREGAKRHETTLAVHPGEVNALTVELTPSGTLSSRPGTVDPALVSEDATRCSACHAPR